MYFVTIHHSVTWIYKPYISWCKKVEGT